jgi:hypothetical protein
VSDLGAALGPAAKLRLGGEVLAAYVRVRVKLRRDGLPRTVDSLRPRSHLSAHSADKCERAPGSGPIGAAGAARGARAVESVLRLLPTDSRCLVTSLVLIAVLARRGGAASLVIGVVPEPRFAAHAWVELNGRPLLKPGDARDGRLVELR